MAAQAASEHRNVEDDVTTIQLMADIGATDVDSVCSDVETSEQPKMFPFLRPRRNGVIAEPWVKGYYKASSNIWNKHDRWEQLLVRVCRKCPVFRQFSNNELGRLIGVMSTHLYTASEEYFQKEGDLVDSLIIVLEGTVESYRDASVLGESGKERRLVNTHNPGSVIDEAAVIWSLPSSHSLQCSVGSTNGQCIVARLFRESFTTIGVRLEFMRWLDRKVMLQQVPLFEMMQEEEVGKLADVLKLQSYQPEEHIIKQGTQGDTMYLMKGGEARVEIRVADDVQEHKHYFAGELFGEIALLRNVPRQASIIACTKVEAYGLTRFEFERLLGPLSQLKQNQYASDPRKLIAGFYGDGDNRGPRGTLKLKGLEPQPDKYGKSQWFVVYRPTSRDAIARMLSGAAVGKGLNIKGKSSKQGVLSGLVPFAQISDNNHKKLIEESPANARTKVYYKNKAAREEARKHLSRVLKTATLKIDIRRIDDLKEYEPLTFGLDIPEPLLREAYLMQPDLSPVMGWETGRRSEPAYMDMNLHGVRNASEPCVVLYQNDESDCMNPRGLLIAYAEKYVKPVVSDFDTFLVASKGMSYEQIPLEQSNLIKWALQQTREVLSTPDHQPWTSRWLTVLKEQAANGFKYTLPKYGFGEATSTRLIADVVTETLACGAIRHGAECFNYTFPQELDDDFLVVWENYPDKPWAYLTEPQVREFLLERISDGYAFPINPVWPVRDKGWHDVLMALRSSPSAAPVLPSWFPPAQGILEIIDELHGWKPDGFVMLADVKDGKKEEEKKQEGNADNKQEQAATRMSKQKSDGPSKPGAKGAVAKGANAKKAWAGSGSPPEQKSAGFSFGRIFGALSGRK